MSGLTQNNVKFAQKDVQLTQNFERAMNMGHVCPSFDPSKSSFPRDFPDRTSVLSDVHAISEQLWQLSTRLDSRMQRFAWSNFFMDVYAT
jgi:hypothetical protein